jgi:hypothetical protein
LAKNDAPIVTLFALLNMWLASAAAHYATARGYRKPMQAAAAMDVARVAGYTATIGSP